MVSGQFYYTISGEELFHFFNKKAVFIRLVAFRKRLMEGFLRTNIWNKEGFDMCSLGEKSKFIAKIKHIKKCIQWSKQRTMRGYADIDRWNMFSYLQVLIPDMLQDLRENRSGSPSCLGENYTNDEGILVNDTCHEEWDKMIFLWRESREETCSRKNPYEEEYDKAFAEFHQKYGIFGEKLQTEAELEKTGKEAAEERFTLWMSCLNIKKFMICIVHKSVSCRSIGNNAKMKHLIC